MTVTTTNMLSAQEAAIESGKKVMHGTVTGNGDLLLPQNWRMLAPVEGLTGILMGGLSTGLFFGITSRLFARREQIGGAGTSEQEEIVCGQDRAHTPLA